MAGRFYKNDDDDKKKSGGSSSASSSSSSGSSVTPQQANQRALELHVNTAMNGAPANTPIGTIARTAPVGTNAVRSNWGQGWNLNFSSGGSNSSGAYRSGSGYSSGSQTRGSSAYNQDQQSNTPQNSTQALLQSNSERFGVQGLRGVGNGQPDIRSDRWYSGDTPTSIDIAARIMAFDPQNKDAINAMWEKRYTRGDETYSPYAGITSEAVYRLAELGVKIPDGGLTRDYCQQALAAAAQQGLLEFSDTSGNVKSPGKRASKDKKAAYWLAKAAQDLDRTEKAEREWAAFAEDVKFKAGDTSRNMSDEEIWNSIDWSKYPTLRQAEQDRLSQQPSEFVRALDIDFNYFSGMCWAARNGGGTGDAFSDAVYARMGEGNQWQYDEGLARKRDVNSPDYDPYSLGGTMYKAQLYFGTHDLGTDFVNSHRDYGVSSDNTLVGYYQSVAKADDFTVACNEELAKVKGEVDDFLEDYLKHPNSDPPSDEAIADLLDDIFIDNSDYRNIQKLNNSLVNAGKQPLEETTGVIGSGDTVGLYKRSNLERYIQERLSERASNVDPHDAANDTNKGLDGALDRMYNNVGNFFTGLFGPKEPYVPTDENGNPVEVKPEPSKANVQSSLPSMEELVNSGIAVRTASATVSDVGGSLAARPTPTPMPSATPAPGSVSPSREEYENAKRESEAWQQDMLRKRQNMAQGKFALRETSSPTDKQTYKSAYPEFDDDVAATKDGIENGSMTEQQSYDSMLGSADALAGKTYFSDVETVESYEALQDIVAQEEDKLNGMPEIPGETMPVNPQTGAPMTEDELAAARLDAMQTGDTERWEYLSQFGAAVQTDEDKRAIADKTAVRESYEQHKAQLDAMKPQYDEAMGHLDAIDAKYAMAAEMVTDGVDTGLGVRATDVMDAIRNGFNEVPLPDWSAYDAYAMAEANGESQEQIVAAAKANIANDDEAITQIQALLDMADRYGLNIPDRYRANMQETLRQYEANKKDSEYYLLRTNPDFAEKVAAGDSAEKWAKEKFHTGSSIGYALYAFKHNTADRSLYAQYPLMGQMSQAELDTAQYLLETQGPVTADEYYLHLGDSQYGRLNTRFTEDAMQRAAAFSERNAVGGTVLSIAMAPLNSTGAFQIIFDKVTGRTSNPNSMLSAGQKASSAMRQEARGRVVGTLSEPFGGIDSPVGKVLGLVYDGGTSAGDTLVNMGWGKALGLVGNGSTWMDKLSVSAMLPAASAGTSSYNEAIRKGGTEQQATLMGAVSFLGEWLTEAIEMSDVMNAISTGVSEAAEGAVKGIWAYLKKQIPELGNEIVGESVSDIIERVGDDVIMGELSDKAKSVDAMTSALMDADPNMTEQLARSEAEYQAELDGWKSTAYAGLLGGFAAGLSTTGGYAVGNMATTTEQFLRAYEVQRDLEAHGMPKANARVAARNIVATNADNTAVYGPQLNAELAENEAQMAQEEAEAAVAAEDLNRRTHEFAEELNSDAAREEQTDLRQANAETQTTEEAAPTEQPTESRRPTRNIATTEQSQAGRAEFSRRMFALEQGSMGGTSQKVVAITSVLDQDTASSDELTQSQARAAAQGLVETFGDNAIPVIQRLMMRARTEGVDNGAVMEAVQVAGLSDGAANQVFAGLNPRAISAENFNAFMQAANLDMADQEIRGQMRKRTLDVMVAAEKARRISEGAAKDLQAAAERTRSASRRRQHAQQQHEAKVQEVEAITESLAQADAEFDAEITGDTENAIRDVASDLPGAIIAEGQLAQQQRNAEAEEAAAVRAEKEAAQAVDAELTRQAQQAVEERMRAVQETRERRADIVEAQRRAIMGGKGTMFVDPKTKLEFHYAIVPVNALITSNTDNGGVNPDYPARLQPRDRTRYSSQVDLENMANGGLTPELLGADNRVQHGAPVVGPDFIVESGNQRTMGIRKAMQNGKANGYTEWLRANAESFGFAPDVVTDNSVLVRVRDTDVDRVAFTREANTVDMAKLSPSETAAVDADMLTPERMAMFVPNDNGSVDNADNREFVKMYRQEIIPEYERGSYQDNKGENAEDLYRRIKRGLFNRAYHDPILTAAVTENTGDEVKNIMNAMTNVAPKVALVADGVASGNLYDLDVTQNIVDAAKLIREIRRDGISLDERLNQSNMFEGSIDPTTEAIARMFDANKRSGTKITRALNNLLDDITNLGAPDQVRLDGMEMTEAPDKATFVQNSLNRTAGVAELESQGAVEGQTSMLEGVTSDVTSTDETDSSTEQAAPTTEQAAPTTAPTTGTTDEVQAYIAPSTQTTQQTTQQTAQPKHSPYAIANNLMSALGIGNYNGTRKMVTRKNGKLRNQPKSVLGYYNTRAKYIAVRPNEAGNYFTTMHEIGHAIADRIGMTGTQQMVENLDPAFAAGYKNNPSVLPGEAFAEFYRQYMESEAQARAFAGDQFVNDFEYALESADIADTVHAAANELRAYIGGNIHEKMRTMIHDRSETKPKLTPSRMSQIVAFRVDQTSAAEKVLHAIREQTGETDVPLMYNLRKAGLMNNFSDRKVINMLEENLTDPHGNIIGKGLKKRWSEVGFKETEDYNELNEYAVLKLSLERDAQGKPVLDGITMPTEAREARIREIDETHPHIRDAFNVFQNYRKEFEQAWLVDTNYLGEKSQEIFDRMNALNPSYVPVQRVMPNQKVANGASRSGFTIKNAKGSTFDIINPLDTWAEMMSNIVNAVEANKVAQAWDRAFQTFSLGEFGREITPDTKEYKVDTTSLQKRIEKILNEPVWDGDIEQDKLDAILKIIGPEQNQWVTQNGTSARNAISVVREDGSLVHYQINDPDLFRLLSAAGRGHSDAVILAMNTAGRLSRAMTMLTTGSSPLFAIPNAFRDFANSVNFGSWAYTYFDGFPKWLISVADIVRNSNKYQEYKALGGGGWTKVDTGRPESTRELRTHMVEDYGKDGVANTIRNAGEKVWHTVTMEKVNEVIEQASRYAEYRFGKNNTNTEEGRVNAFLAGQDDTVDFARSGYGDILPFLKQIVPFIGASVQGVYRTGRMFTEGERSRLAPRLAKTIFNNALASALAAAFIVKFGTDEEKKAFENMRDDLKTKYIYLPNIGHLFGQYPLIRIPIEQDPIAYAVHSAATNAVWNGTTDQYLIDIGATANTILDNLNPATNPVWQPFIDAANNRNWYGGKNVPTRLEGLPAYAQYTEETPDFFVGLGRAATAVPFLENGLSPINMQYIAQQYTGFIGQMLIPAFSKNKYTGELGGWKAALTAAQRRLTTDPLVSTEITGVFYDGYDMVENVVDLVNNNKPLSMLRRGLSKTEATKAYKDAYKLVHKGGVLYDTKAYITDCYAQIDQIYARTDINDTEKYEMSSKIRSKMIDKALKANEAVEAYREKYITGDDVATKMLMDGQTIKKPKK